jgi:hypothetical protein
MIRYLLRLSPEIRYGFHLGGLPLTREALEQLVEGSIVHSIDDGGIGYPAVVDLQLDCEPNEQALNAILIAVERCGYSIAEGEITQWVDAEFQGAFWGLLSGVGCGALAKNEGAVMALAVAGAFLGHVAGASIQRHEVIYTISCAYPRGPVELIPVNNAQAPSITLADWLDALTR